MGLPFAMNWLDHIYVFLMFFFYLFLLEFYFLLSNYGFPYIFYSFSFIFSPLVRKLMTS